MNEAINQKATMIYEMMGGPLDVVIYARPEVVVGLAGEIEIAGHVYPVKLCDSIPERQIGTKIFSDIYMIDRNKASEESFIAAIKNNLLR